MVLHQEAVDEFKKIYQKEYGILISDEKARKYGERLIVLVQSVYGNNLPDMKDEYE